MLDSMFIIIAIVLLLLSLAYLYMSGIFYSPDIQVGRAPLGKSLVGKTAYLKNNLFSKIFKANLNHTKPINSIKNRTTKLDSH